MFKNEVTWFFIGLFTFLSIIAYKGCDMDTEDTKVKKAEEETKQLQYQWKIDSVKQLTSTDEEG